MIGRKLKLLIVVGIVLVLAWPSISPMLRFAWGPGGGADRFYLPNGNCNVAVVYLYYNVNKDSNVIPALKNVMEVAPTGGFYSVKSFYEKYGVHLTFHYYDYPVTKLLPRTYGTNDQWDVTRSWASYNNESFGVVYNRNDLLLFFVQSNVQLQQSYSYNGVTWWPYAFVTIGHPLVVFDAFGGSRATLFTNMGFMAWAVAHEFGHVFGAVDHYPLAALAGSPGAVPINDARCVMNAGGDGNQHLTKGTRISHYGITYSVDTIFGATDLSAGHLHLSYFDKYPTSYYQVHLSF